MQVHLEPGQYESMNLFLEVVNESGSGTKKALIGACSLPLLDLVPEMGKTHFIDRKLTSLTSLTSSNEKSTNPTSLTKSQKIENYGWVTFKASIEESDAADEETSMEEEEEQLDELDGLDEEEDIAVSLFVSDIKARDLHDTGSSLDKQDPCIVFTIGTTTFTTARQKDAGSTSHRYRHRHRHHPYYR